MDSFRLDPEEIAREIHHILREEYPEMELDGPAIHACIDTNKSDSQTAITFRVSEYCRRSNLDFADIGNKLLMGFEIESEKNLHDKILFRVNLTDGNLIFTKTKEKMNGQG